MKKVLILLLVMLFLVACAAEEENTTPSHTNTPTPPIPTPTLSPTSTPSPTPTATPIPPTPTPTMISMEELIEELDADVIYYLLDQERNEYMSGYYRVAIGIANALIDTWLGDYPLIYNRRAESYAALGDFDNAVIDMKEALKRVPAETDDDWAGVNNDLCWYLAMAGKPEEALPYCEEAVSIDPIAMYLDSRGVAYSMLGKTDEAIADFEEVIKEFEGKTDLPLVQIRESREKWISELMAGVDFSTPEFLVELQADEIDPNAHPEPDLLKPEDYSLDHFTQILINDGFSLATTESVGRSQLYLYFIEFNECTNIIILDESNNMLVRPPGMQLYGCIEEQVAAETYWFLRFLFQTNPNEDLDTIQMGQGFAWMASDIADLLEGTIEETELKEIGGIEFTAKVGNMPDLGTGIAINADWP